MSDNPLLNGLVQAAASARGTDRAFIEEAIRRLFGTPREPKPPSDMVERVARRLHEQWLATFRGPKDMTAWDDLAAMMREYGYGMARAAIAAMREPTEAMLNAEMSLGGYGFGDECFSADPKEVWQAMIDEALKCP